MFISRALIAIVPGLYLALCGCGGNEFSAKAVIEARPVNVEGEQVTLTSTQIDCGVQSDLWEAPSQVSQRSTARLTAKGRELKFNDDVSIGEANYLQPYVQVRGDVSLQVLEVASVQDEDKDTKLVSAKIGVRIPHPCFPNPLPVMGVRHGNFSSEAPVAVRLRQAEDGWHVEKLVH